MKQLRLGENSEGFAGSSRTILTFLHQPLFLCQSLASSVGLCVPVFQLTAIQMCVSVAVPYHGDGKMRSGDVWTPC